MFGYASILFLGFATLLQGLGFSRGDVITPIFFGLLGLACLAVHLVTGWLHR